MNKGEEEPEINFEDEWEKALLEARQEEERKKQMEKEVIESMKLSEIILTNR